METPPCRPSGSPSKSVLTRQFLLNVLKSRLFRAFGGDFSWFWFGDIFFFFSVVALAIPTSQWKTSVSRGGTDMCHHPSPAK